MTAVWTPQSGECRDIKTRDAFQFPLSYVCVFEDRRRKGNQRDNSNNEEWAKRCLVMPRVRNGRSQRTWRWCGFALSNERKSPNVHVLLASWWYQLQHTSFNAVTYQAASLHHVSRSQILVKYQQEDKDKKLTYLLIRINDGEDTRG